jgi:hypothetical protein
MIGIDGQYRASFSIGSMKDFLKEEQLLCFKLIEDTSNVLPIFQLDIWIYDEKILQYVNEGKNLIIKIGQSVDKMTEAQFKITKSVPVKEGEHKILLHLVGIFAEMSYLTDKKLLITDKISSVDAIKQVLKQHTNFSFSTNVSGTSDKMNWIQPHTTNRKFISTIWTHMYIPGSFAALGTTITGEFRLRDIKKLAAEKPKFIFKCVKPEDKKDNEIIYEMPYDYSNSSTLNNQIYAYGKEKLVANLESGEFTLLKQESVTPTLAMSNDSMADKNIKPRYDEHCNQSEDNVHANFWKAKLQNLVNLFTFSTVKITVNYHHDFHNIHVLDLVYFKDEEIQSGQKYSSETVTGLYVVTKVSRVIENKSFRTYVEMCRETPNSIQVKETEVSSENVIQ